MIAPIWISVTSFGIFVIPPMEHPIISNVRMSDGSAAIQIMAMPPASAAG